MWTQDKGYFDLMRELWGSPDRWNVRKTYADVANRLGVDEETVRNRLRRLKESGFLVGWRVVPSPAVFERESAMLYLDFEDQERRDAAVPKLKLMDGVTTLASAYGKDLMVTYYDDSEHKASKKIAGIQGLTVAQPIGGMKMPPTDFRMTPTDWQIVGLMLHDAERDIPTVAKKTRVSSRTVKRRLNAMIDTSAIAVMPIIDQSKSGGVSYTMMVECQAGRIAEVGELIASKIKTLVFRAGYGKDGLIFGFNAANVAEGTEVLRSVKDLDGLKSARLLMVDQVIYAFDWLERESRNRASAPAKH
jgi:DNA-binding Lrp family transcriptional regulator